jgi:hypothetical protein
LKIKAIDIGEYRRKILIKIGLGTIFGLMWVLLFCILGFYKIIIDYYIFETIQIQLILGIPILFTFLIYCIINMSIEISEFQNPNIASNRLLQKFYKREKVPSITNCYSTDINAHFFFHEMWHISVEVTIPIKVLDKIKGMSKNKILERLNQNNNYIDINSDQNNENVDVDFFLWIISSSKFRNDLRFKDWNIDTI